MKRWHLLIALCAALVFSAGAGSYKGASWGAGSFTNAGASYQAGGVTKVDTVRVLSRDKRYPNNAAVTAGYVEEDIDYYTHYNRGAAGVAVRWGANYRNAPDTPEYVTTANSDYRIRVQVTRPEDDFAWQSTARNGFLWFDCTGLEPGMEVLDAGLIFNVSAYSNPTIPAGGFLAARLDTVTKDYRMLNSRTVGAGYSAGNDTARFSVTWNAVDFDHTAAWVPAMTARTDRHDFGPRSDTVLPAGSYTQGQCLRLDVTDAVQQACDNAVEDPAILDRGLLFLIYGSTTGTEVTFDISAGNFSGVESVGKGAPVFVCEAVTRRGAKAWGSGDVPFVMTFDDNWDAHVDYASTMWAAGLKFTAVTYNSGFVANASYDSLLSPNLSRTTIIHHSKNHPGIGALTGASLEEQVERSTYYTGAPWTTPPGNAAVQHYAWPVASGQQTYGILPISSFVTHGYLSARAASVKAASTSPVGTIAFLSWDNVSNIYAVGSVFASSIFQDTGSPAAWAFIREEMTDAIDVCYTDHGKGALVVYAHKTSDGVTAANLALALAVADTLNCAVAMDYDDVISRRRAGSAFLDPAAITEANGYTAAEAATAARYDSLRTANSDDNMLQVWIAPK